MTYATKADIMERYDGEASDALIDALLEESALLIDMTKSDAKLDAKRLVSIRMVVRALGSGGDISIPMGASQGTVSALGYSQTWTMSGGTAGELYMSKTEKQLLGVGNRIGASSPLEALND